jgi:hypothetical protein
LALKPGSKYGPVQGFDRVKAHEVTQDMAGVNVWAGSLEVIPGFKIVLTGPHSVEAWPSVIPARGVVFRQVTGPVVLQVPLNAELNVLRYK